MSESKKFFNQRDNKLATVASYVILEFLVDVPSIYGFGLYKSLDLEIGEKIKRYDMVDENQPTILRLKGDFKFLKENLDKEELNSFFVSLVNIVASHNITKEKVDREQRLTSPKSLDNSKLSLMVRVDLANKKLIYPFFNIEIVDLDYNVLCEAI